VIGGLLASTVVTLLLIPVTYNHPRRPARLRASRRSWSDEDDSARRATA